MTIQVVSSTVTPAATPTDAKVDATAEVKAKDAAPAAPEANAPEQKESTQDSEPSETVAKDSETSDAEVDTDAGDTEAKDEGQDKPKKKGGFQRRIDKLNARVTAREQELEYWKQQAMKAAGASKAEPTVETTQAATAPVPGKPVPDNFDTHAEYVEAIADWKAEQKFLERDQREAKGRAEIEQSKRVQTYAERRAEFAEKHDDFEDVLEAVDHIPVSPVIREIILESENGPELAYELAKNAKEYARMCKLHPLAAAREVGKIEARLAARDDSKSKAEPTKITQAPKPIAPVGGGKGGVVKSIDDPNLSQSEYEKLRLEQMKKRGA